MATLNQPRPAPAAAPKPLEVPASAILPKSKVEDSRKIVELQKPVGLAIEALLSAGQPLDAVRLMAHALPRREAVWWACLCLRDKSDAPLEAAMRWVVSPTDENRRAAFAAAEASDYGPPSSNAALAAFWSGGSMAPAGLKEVPPAPHLLPTAVANAVILAGLATEEEKWPAFVALGKAVAEGKNRWPEVMPAKK